MYPDLSRHTWVPQQTYDHISSESLPEPYLAWLLLGTLVFHWPYETALLAFDSFYVGHSTPQKWFDQIGQRNFPILLYPGWACGPLKSLLILLLRRDFAHLYHPFLLVQVDPLDLLVQEVLVVHKHIWAFYVSFFLGQRSPWRKNHLHPHHHWGQDHHHLLLLPDYHFFWGDPFLHPEISDPHLILQRSLLHLRFQVDLYLQLVFDFPGYYYPVPR